ncbi:MAG: phosphomannomutase/phosphoglucomutase [Candidatus Micrarchaeia archaeon]
MKKIDFLQLFSGYDVRGVYNEDLDERVAQVTGSAFAEFLSKKGVEGTVFVGADNRASSPALKDAAVLGLQSKNLKLVDLGEVTTGLFHFALSSKNAVGGLMVTASHNPPEYNGFKLYDKNLPLSRVQMDQVRYLAQNSLFEKRELEEVEKLDLSQEYVQDVAGKNPLKRGLKVVLDAANGNAGLFAPSIFRKMGCDVVELYCTPDSSFPNHPADPSKEENVEDLKKKVLEEKADLGIAFDGDGDRTAFVDEQGRFVRADDANIIFARDALSKSRNAAVVYDLRLSLAFKEEVERLGGSAVMTKSGRIAVRSELLKNNAVFGGETSGHFYFKENYGYDDAIYSGAKMTSIISRGEPLSRLTDDLPHYPATVELRPFCQNNKKRQVVQALQTFLSEKFEISTLDGVRVELEGGWGLVRVSNTQPALSVRAEAKTRESLEKIYGILKNLLGVHDVQLPELK